MSANDKTEVPMEVDMEVEADTETALQNEPTSALDAYGKEEKDYEQYRPLFKNNGEFEIFKMLPGVDAVKEKILNQYKI